MSSRINLIAQLDIVFLTPEEPGAVITQGGDIDNRLKTLLDALRMPKAAAELPDGDKPCPDESPFFCLSLRTTLWLLGGIGLILGLGTRLWALLQGVDMAFAIAFVHLKQGFLIHGALVERGGQEIPVVAGWEWQALILVACLTLVIGGPGSLSIDAWLRKRFLLQGRR